MDKKGKQKESSRGLAQYLMEVQDGSFHGRRDLLLGICASSSSCWSHRMYETGNTQGTNAKSMDTQMRLKKIGKKVRVRRMRFGKAVAKMCQIASSGVKKH